MAAAPLKSITDTYQHYYHQLTESLEQQYKLQQQSKQPKSKSFNKLQQREQHWSNELYEPKTDSNDLIPGNISTLYQHKPLPPQPRVIHPGRCIKSTISNKLDPVVQKIMDRNKTKNSGNKMKPSIPLKQSTVKSK